MMPGLKAQARRAVAWASHHTRLALSRLTGKIAILGYHRVLGAEELRTQFVQPGMYVERSAFEGHLRFLAEHFRLLSFAELLERWETDSVRPDERYAVITFDDGWRDNYVHAWPILRRLGVPATVFVPTGLVGTRRRLWTDDLGTCLRAYVAAAAARRLPGPVAELGRRYPWLGRLEGGGAESRAAEERIDEGIEAAKGMPEDGVARLTDILRKALRVELSGERAFVDWDEMREMSLHGVAFGSHSCEHRIMTRLSADELRREAEDSLGALRAGRVRVTPVFCYPNGDADDRVAAAVRQAGYRAAVSGRVGCEGPRPADAFRLRRIALHHDVASTVPLFGLRLLAFASGWSR